MARAADASQLRTRPEDAEIDLEGLVGYNLKRAYVVVSSDFRRALGEDGFAPRQFSALSLIVQFPEIIQSELARKLGIERSGLVSIVDDLEGRGLVSRMPVPGDRRVQALTPTKDGRSAYLNARDVVRAHEAALLSDLAPEEVETLIGLLQKIRKTEA
ncbi:MarR family transcriptional regulator [Aestuariicoccus sp. MJ-SS9]|uniref:MarR family winged helix-turn-helix transcriptional regulator n=1 Tax=Aestuariicoccus sp. MJ-SS9 TaxID=3079855 RepID=UPI0029151A2D|nr:MarR family transcriptional regulator [Aestuariicoccus sp. MJ-SS9]MDU8912281.1 MarR family transcriptional regulator [Aestuariicoccus sp. MJ-SS9]